MPKISSYLEQQNTKGDDAFFVVEIGASIWFCIADGAGGTGAGNAASQFVIDSFKKLSQAEDFNDPEDFESFLRELDVALVRELNGGETTAIVGRVFDDQVIGASVGDSEAWLFNLEYDYELTSMQIIKPLLGSGASIPIGFGPMNVEQFMLLGSDGLFKYARHHDIQSLLTADVSAMEIAGLAKYETGGLQDDISVIFISKES